VCLLCQLHIPFAAKELYRSLSLNSLLIPSPLSQIHPSLSRQAISRAHPHHQPQLTPPTAIPGTIVGAFYGTLRTSTPSLFAIVSGAQWFAIGSTFWGIRTSLLNSTGLLNWWNATRGAPLHPRHDLSPTPDDRLRASAIAGALTGSSLGLLFRGPRNVVPGTLMFALFGWAGQHGYNYLDGRNSADIEERADARKQGRVVERDNFMQKIAKSRWSPMSVLTDEQYEDMMRERMLKIDAEIAILDERIEGYRRQAREQAQKQKPEHEPEQR
jgi:hypothetical protein